MAFDPESEKLGCTLDVPLRKNDHPPGRAADDEFGIESKFWLKLPLTVTAVAWAAACRSKPGKPKPVTKAAAVRATAALVNRRWHGVPLAEVRLRDAAMAIEDSPPALVPAETTNQSSNPSQARRSLTSPDHPGSEGVASRLGNEGYESRAAAREQTMKAGRGLKALKKQDFCNAIARDRPAKQRAKRTLFTKKVFTKKVKEDGFRPEW